MTPRITAARATTPMKILLCMLARQHWSAARWSRMPNCRQKPGMTLTLASWTSRITSCAAAPSLSTSPPLLSPPGAPARTRPIGQERVPATETSFSGRFAGGAAPSKSTVLCIVGVSAATFPDKPSSAPLLLHEPGQPLKPGSCTSFFAMGSSGIDNCAPRASSAGSRTNSSSTSKLTVASECAPDVGSAVLGSLSSVALPLGADVVDLLDVHEPRDLGLSTEVSTASPCPSEILGPDDNELMLRDALDSVEAVVERCDASELKLRMNRPRTFLLHSSCTTLSSAARPCKPERNFKTSSFRADTAPSPAIRRINSRTTSSSRTDSSSPAFFNKSCRFSWQSDPSPPGLLM
mmetsp:Transcript_108705/g.232258  ORF Transcript_108705/g.232258 Transcript_108705/m.232258 type:complete len:350 (+) Transcript_108705:838-1887(+)